MGKAHCVCCGGTIKGPHCFLLMYKVWAWNLCSPQGNPESKNSNGACILSICRADEEWPTESHLILPSQLPYSQQHLPEMPQWLEKNYLAVLEVILGVLVASQSLCLNFNR